MYEMNKRFFHFQKSKKKKKKSKMIILFVLIQLINGYQYSKCETPYCDECNKIGYCNECINNYILENWRCKFKNEYGCKLFSYYKDINGTNNAYCK